MADKTKEYIQGHGSVPPPQTVSKSGPRNRRRDEISVEDSDEDQLVDAPDGAAKESGRDAEYLAGHGSKPPPKTIERRGPRNRKRDEIAVDDEEDEDGAPSEGGAASGEAPGQEREEEEEEEEDDIPWYHQAGKGMIRLTRRAATMIDNNLTNPDGGFEIGQKVRCKLEGDDQWVTGYVTGVDPVQVGGSIWDYVEPCEAEGEEASGSGGVFGGFLDMFSAAEAEEADGAKPWYDMSFKLDGILNLFGQEEEPQKSPRHHFNEGETLKSLEQHKQATSPRSSLQKQQNSATTSSQDTSASSLPAELESPMNLAASFISDCGSALADSAGIVDRRSRASSAEELDLVSCLKTGDTTDSVPKEKLRVTFDAVYMRQHKFEPDGSGGLPSSGIPFGLGWDVESDHSASIDEFEEARQGERIERHVFMMEGFVPPKERSAFALAKGFSKEEVSAAELSTFKTNRRRRASLAFVEEVDGC